MAGMTESLARRADVSAGDVREALEAPIAARRIHALRRAPDRYIAELALAKLADKASAALASLAAPGAASVGVPRSTLLQRIAPAADPRWAEAIERALAARGTLVIAGGEGSVCSKAPMSTIPLIVRALPARSIAATPKAVVPVLIQQRLHQRGLAGAARSREQYVVRRQSPHELLRVLVHQCLLPVDALQVLQPDPVRMRD